MKDTELKQNRIYWIEITDKTLTALLGKQLMMRWTGLCFRTIDYDLNKIAKRHEDSAAMARYKLMTRNLEGKPGSMLYVDQVKIFREAEQKELDSSCHSERSACLDSNEKSSREESNSTDLFKVIYD